MPAATTILVIMIATKLMSISIKLIMKNPPEFLPEGFPYNL